MARDRFAGHTAVATFPSMQAAEDAMSALERHGFEAEHVSLLDRDAPAAADLQWTAGQVVLSVRSDDSAAVDRAEEILRSERQLIFVDRVDAGGRRVGGEGRAADTISGPRAAPPAESEETRALAARYRVLRMEPLAGDDRPDPRTRPGPRTTGSAPGPDMQATRGFEGQTVTLNQLEGMGRLSWESDRVARLDTATESYRVELESLETPAADARVRRAATRVEAARARTPSGADASWRPWIVVALVVLILIGFAIVSWGTAFR